MTLSSSNEASMWLMYSAIAARVRTVAPKFSGEYIHVSPHTWERNECSNIQVKAERLTHEKKKLHDNAPK